LKVSQNVMEVSAAMEICRKRKTLDVCIFQNPELLNRRTIFLNVFTQVINTFTRFEFAQIRFVLASLHNAFVCFTEMKRCSETNFSFFMF